MKILIINQFYKPDVAATGQLLADLAESLAKQGHEVHVICSRCAYGGGKTRFPSSQSLNGVHIHRVSATGFGRKNIIGRLVDYLCFYILAMFKAVIMPRMDMCIVLTTPPFIALCGLILRLLKRTQVILWSMDIYPEIAVAYGAIKNKSILHKFLSGISKCIYRRAVRIISLGEVMTEKLVEAGASQEKIITVHNWVPGEIVDSNPSGNSVLYEKWQVRDRVKLMYLGNLGIGHELESAVRAMKELGQNVKVDLLFVGNGKMRERLIDLASELDLDTVSFHRPVPLADLPNALAIADIHLVSQKPGTQGLIVPSKLYGVLAAGRPTIFVGPDDCETAMILRKSNAGIIVCPGDIHGVAEAIKKLAYEQGVREIMGENAKQYYMNHFGRDRSVSQIQELIEAI